DALPPAELQWTEVGGAVMEFWLDNGILARYNVEQAWSIPDAEATWWKIPEAEWRCPEVRDEEDHSRATHEGIIHHAPNEWLFSNGNWNDLPNGWKNNFSDVYTGWEGKFGGSWRKVGDVWQPREIISLMCNVNYFVPSHGHRDAREYYGL